MLDNLLEYTHGLKMKGPTLPVRYGGCIISRSMPSLDALGSVSLAGWGKAGVH